MALSTIGWHNLPHAVVYTQGIRLAPFHSPSGDDERKTAKLASVSKMCSVFLSGFSGSPLQ
jgi:hypothetical protein